MTNNSRLFAIIPAKGEPKLPATGIFQVKVIASNSAGDSSYSQPVDATCGPPGPITGLKCTAITNDQIKVEWNEAIGADTYAVTGRSGHGRGAHIVYGVQGNGDFTTDNVSDLRDDTSYSFKVVAYNTRGTSKASVSCRTLDDNWLVVECSGSGILRVRWDDPSGNQTAPSGYAGTITLLSPLLEGLVASYDEAYDSSNTSVEWGAIGAAASEYQVYVRSKNANGGPAYSQTKTITCPSLSAPNYSGPNVPEDLSTLERIIARIAVGVLGQHSGYGAVNASKLFFGGADYVLDQVSRKCSTAHDANTGLTTKTCNEVWNEYITVRLDESSLDETLVAVVDAIVPDDEVQAIGQLVVGSISLRVLWKKIKEKGAKKVAAKVVSRSGAAIALETYAVWLYYEGTAPYAEINGQDNCVFEQPEDRGNDIKNWTAVEVSDSATETVGRVRSIRNVIVHYCEETD